MLLLILGSLPFVFVDVSVGLPGWIYTRLEPQHLYVPATARVVLLHRAHHDPVNAGDTILVLDHQGYATKLGELIRQKKIKEDVIRDLTTMIGAAVDGFQQGSFSFRLARFKKTYVGFTQLYLSEKAQIDQKTTKHERVANLYRLDLIPKADYEASSYALKQLLWQHHLSVNSQVQRWQSELDAYKVKQLRIETEKEFVRSTIDKHHVVAPIAGVLMLHVNAEAGTMLSANQQFGKISPDGQLYVNLLVPPAQIGKLYRGQRVKVQVDTYNYHHWGALQAVVEEISDDVVFDPSANHAFYRVRCVLQTNSLKHKDGRVATLRKGMTVTCRMITGRKSLFGLITARADEIFNPACFAGK